MRYQVRWSDAAYADLASIVDYITPLDPVAAVHLASRLVECAESLHVFPHRGTPVGEDVRQLSLIHPYLLRCRILGDHVIILSIRHGAREPD